jgi:AcrR family transcriptional regulator
MFSKKSNRKVAPSVPSGSRGPVERRRRGRPPGRTKEGEATRRRLYTLSVRMIATRGYEATTLRDIAKRAGVSPGLLYRYFPSKRAVVLALYEDLSTEYAVRASRMGAGPWQDRFLFALEASLDVLGRQRATLAALTSVLFGDAEGGLFAPATAASRRRVEAVFHEAVRGASDAPSAEAAAALGRILYFAHLAIILWWLLDKSSRQRATKELIALLSLSLPFVGPALWREPARTFVETVSRLCGEGLLGG